MAKLKMIEDPPKTKRNVTAQTNEQSVEDKIMDLDDTVDKMNNEISESGTLDKDQAIRVTFQHLFYPSSPFNLRNMLSKITALEEKIEQKNLKITALEVKIGEKDLEITNLKEKVVELHNQEDKNKKDLKKQVESLSIDSYKTKVTLANIPLTLSNPDDKIESPVETTKAVVELLKQSGQTLSCIKEVKRLYPKEPITGEASSSAKPKPKDPKVLIDFLNMTELKKFISKLKEIRAMEKYKLLHLQNFCPPHLLSDFRRANEKGYQLRTTEKMITRTFINDNGVVLKVKSQASEPFKKVKWD